jgi:DNA primase
VSWAYVQEAALLTRAMLSELGLESWVKTSGGKGLQVVVPLVPKLDSQVVKGRSRGLQTGLARSSSIPAQRPRADDRGRVPSTGPDGDGLLDT